MVQETLEDTLPDQDSLGLTGTHQDKKGDQIMKRSELQNLVNNTILGTKLGEISREDIEKKAPLLPDLCRTALECKYGLGELDPVDEREIAYIIHDENNIHMTEELVNGILSDALHMVQDDTEPFPEINVEDSLPDNAKYAKIFWDHIDKYLWHLADEAQLEKKLREEYGDKDFVIIPTMDDLYLADLREPHPCPGDEDIKLYNRSDVETYFGLANIIVRKLDEMGVPCITWGTYYKGVISPISFYDYAFLEKDLIMKVIHDNPIKLFL